MLTPQPEIFFVPGMFNSTESAQLAAARANLIDAQQKFKQALLADGITYEVLALEQEDLPALQESQFFVNNSTAVAMACPTPFTGMAIRWRTNQEIHLTGAEVVGAFRGPIGEISSLLVLLPDGSA
jgi:hypothetical protein